MTIVKYAAVGLVALVLGVIIGTSNTPDPITVEVPGPTTEVEVEVIREVVREVEVPGPEVEVVPEICTDALWAADAIISENLNFPIDVLSAYVDYPDEDLLDFGRRVENLITDHNMDESERLFDDYVEKADQCHEAGG